VKYAYLNLKMGIGFLFYQVQLLVWGVGESQVRRKFSESSKWMSCKRLLLLIASTARDDKTPWYTGAVVSPRRGCKLVKIISTERKLIFEYPPRTTGIFHKKMSPTTLRDMFSGLASWVFGGGYYLSDPPPFRNSDTIKYTSPLGDLSPRNRKMTFENGVLRW